MSALLEIENKTPSEKQGLSESPHPPNTTPYEVGYPNLLSWASPIVLLLGGLESALDITHRKPSYVNALNQIVASGVNQQQSAIQEYLDPVWEVVGSLRSIEERDAKVQHATEGLKHKIHEITDSTSQVAILYIKGLDASEHFAATQYWERTAKQLSSFLERSMKITLKRFCKALDAAERIWRQREVARGEIANEAEILLEQLVSEEAD